MDLLQYAGSIFVLAGLYLYGKHNIYAPIWSAVGCGLWAIAGVIIGAYPLAGLNVILLAINLYNLGLWYEGRKHGEVVSVDADEELPAREPKLRAHNQHKLDEAQIEDVKKLLLHGYTYAHIAGIMKVSSEAIAWHYNKLSAEEKGARIEAKKKMRTGYTKLTTEDIKDIYDLFNKGEPIAVICQKTGRGTATVRNAIARWMEIQALTPVVQQSGVTGITIVKDADEWTGSEVGHADRA